MFEQKALVTWCKANQMLKQPELDKEPDSCRTETKTEQNKNGSAKPSWNHENKKGIVVVKQQQSCLVKSKF